MIAPSTSNGPITDSDTETLTGKLQPPNQPDEDLNDDEEEEDDITAATPGADGAKKKKKKKKPKKKKMTQTEPPRVGLSKLFPTGVFPVGEIQDYKDECVPTIYPESVTLTLFACPIVISGEKLLKKNDMMNVWSWRILKKLMTTSVELLRFTDRFVNVRKPLFSLAARPPRLPITSKMVFVRWWKNPVSSLASVSPPALALISARLTILPTLVILSVGTFVRSFDVQLNQ
jgi:hypothetical protein